MPVYTIETPRGRKVKLEADSPDVAMRGAERWDLEDYAASEAQANGINPELVLKQIRVESGSRSSAVSPKGARGPMQLMPGTAQELGVNPDDPYENITGGVRYLKQQLDTFGGDEAKALAAYNAGPGAVRKAGGVPNFPETQDYVRMTSTGRPFAAPAAAPQAPAPAPSAPPRKDQMLGFGRGLFAPVDNTSDRMVGLLRGSPIEAPLASLGRGVAGLLPQSVTDYIVDPGAFYDRKKQQGVVPGKIGEFAGNVASTAWVPGGPLVQGGATGAMLSEQDSPAGLLEDTLYGAAGGKIGASVIGGAGKLIQGVTGDALTLAQKGVPLTIGQMAGGVTKGVEDRLAGLPVIGDIIRPGQIRSLEGMNRAAYNDTLKFVDEALPDGINIGRDAFNYTRQRLSDLYEEVLSPLVVARDAPFAQAVSAAKSVKIGDPKVKAEVSRIIKTEVESRFTKRQMIGDDLKAAQEALGSHINDLMKGKKWERDAAKALQGVKGALEDLVARTSPEAGEMLAKVNKAYAHLKPLETAAARPGARDGVFTVAGMGQGVRKGKSNATVAAGKAPHQRLFDAAANVLPSSVPDSGTAGRVVTALLGSGLLGSTGTALAPVGAPAVGGLLAGLAAYSRGGQKLLTDLVSKRAPPVRRVGKNVRRLAGPAGAGGAVVASEQ